MARNVKVVLTDDVDGSDATQTVGFALDGVTYEIDLSDENASKLRDALAEWVGHARRVSGRKSSGHRAAGAPSDASRIREWAHQNGYEVPLRGRIPKDIRKAYEDAHK
ncbi:Lsr2 protein [Propionibacterium cyclohexanicum]|uniref:Lsr2 protein n=1 Tax=Propionibacterium cyclohexanicum TaxID=64702 RepID=A0A1H9RUF1_9ACTN|nr:Lsr2 family protein [Propionibacterium cyclohexanicum]SER76432.1 Lsr2 protein [Propionibacterium cyclohexanicum]